MLWLKLLFWDYDSITPILSIRCTFISSHSVVHHYEGIHPLMHGHVGNWTSSLTSTEARLYQMSYIEHRNTYTVCVMWVLPSVFSSAVLSVCVCVSPCWFTLSALVWWRIDWAEPFYFIITYQKAFLHINRAFTYWKQTHAWLWWLLQGDSRYERQCTEAESQAAALSARHT